MPTNITLRTKVERSAHKQEAGHLDYYQYSYLSRVYHYFVSCLDLGSLLPRCLSAQGSTSPPRGWVHQAS
jgi:hypothetical protein